MMLSPLVQAGALQNSQSPVDTRGGGDGPSMEPFAIPPLVNIAHFRKVNNSERAPDGGLSLRPGTIGRFNHWLVGTLSSTQRS